MSSHAERKLAKEVNEEYHDPYDDWGARSVRLAGSRRSLTALPFGPAPSLRAALRSDMRSQAMAGANARQ